MKRIKNSKIIQSIIEMGTDFFSNYEGLYSTQAAFYFIISSVPLLMLLLSIIPHIYPVNLTTLIEVINNTIPETFRYYVIRVVKEVYTQSTLPMISISAITTLWAASKSTYSLSLGLKQIYHTNPENITAKKTILLRLMSLLDTVLFIGILIFSIISLVFDKTIANLIHNIMPDRLSFILNFIKISNPSSIFVITVAFVTIYKLFSRTTIPVIKHIPGALIAAIAWVMFSYIYSLYFNNFSSFSVTYGALAAIVFLMLWLKTCMMILLFGAEINMYLHTHQKRNP